MVTLISTIFSASTVDEHAMYLRAGFSPRDKSSAIFKNSSKFQANNGKFKLAYDVGKDVDVFSQVSRDILSSTYISLSIRIVCFISNMQEVPKDESSYEENSFVVDEEEEEAYDVDMSVLGEVTVLEDVSHSKTRTTRRQVCCEYYS